MLYGRPGGRRKKRETPVEVVRRCVEELERDRSVEMED
jgi:hypothetical protein